MQDCQLCNNSVIPDKIYDLLDWEAVADEELIICPKCLSQLIKNKEAIVTIKLERKSGVLAKVMWNRRKEDDPEPGAA